MQQAYQSALYIHYLEHRHRYLQVWNRSLRDNLSEHIKCAIDQPPATACHPLNAMLARGCLSSRQGAAISPAATAGLARRRCVPAHAAPAPGAKGSISFGRVNALIAFCNTACLAAPCPAQRLLRQYQQLRRPASRWNCTWARPRCRFPSRATPRCSCKRPSPRCCRCALLNRLLLCCSNQPSWQSHATQAYLASLHPRSPLLPRPKLSAQSDGTPWSTSSRAAAQTLQGQSFSRCEEAPGRTGNAGAQQSAWVHGGRDGRTWAVASPSCMDTVHWTAPFSAVLPSQRWWQGSIILWRLAMSQSVAGQGLFMVLSIGCG